jgi:hypothetical protein
MDTEGFVDLFHEVCWDPSNSRAHSLKSN